ncbi:zinc finger bed domain-containing protein 4-like [Gigaspora margarita]|uniref:Zinc finger bed domain-containing protein 4-like n=1 Tax=Gigaspora margarita TaxID=4874 RepID=A0A8H3X6L4_GIGMA|nr:zinc finger bed domain-containing protein 4-like [Gigaspora margarita]
MAGYKRNQDSFQASNLNDNGNNSIATNNSEAQPKKRRHLENNDKESICWKYFEPFKVPSENGTITKCTISGCTTRYIWCGSTSNLVGHLKKKHGITKSSTSSTTSTVNSINSEPEINLPLLKFIVSSGAPFSIVDNLKSAGFVNPIIELSTSNIIEDQINKAYNRLFPQLKLKAQQETSITVSIHETDARFSKSYIVITCNWLTKDFELHKILLLANEWYSDMEENNDFFGDTINALEKWELTNLKFYSDYGNFGWFDFDPFTDFEDNYHNLIPLCMNKYSYFNDLFNLIQRTLKLWARENVYTQEMFGIIKAIKNATDNLCDVIRFLTNDTVKREIQNMQIAFNYPTINCDVCIYHKIAFIKLMEKPFMQLVNNYDSYEVAIIREKGKCFKELKLDSLPFDIFPKLLQLFKPLENITCRCHNISTKEYTDLVDKIVMNADNMFKELQFSDNLEHKILKSFLTSFPLYIDLYAKKLALFLDPRSNPDKISTIIIKCALEKCKSYYLKNIFSDDLDKSIQAANKELKCYINRPQSSLDGDINPYEWWQGSKQMLPGLAALAREYLPTLTVDKEDPAKNMDKFIKIHNQDMAGRIAFLQYNMKYIDLYL